MKKCLIFNTIFLAITFICAVDVSATSLGSQSIDVTVGEVDEIDNDANSKEEQSIYSPDTGIFGSENNKSSIVVATIFAIPMASIIIYLLVHAKHKSNKSNNKKWCE